MTDEERGAMFLAVGAMSGAIALWPARHPAAAMIIGVQDASDAAYAGMKNAQNRLLELLNDYTENAVP